MRPLDASFFARDATVVAPELINKVLVTGDVHARIAEVEAYTSDDEASHSFRGVTTRNASMFGPPGVMYVYLIYGMHHCINIVTGHLGDGQAVLIRGALVEGVDRRRTDGPGKLAKALGVDRSWDGRLAVVLDDGTPPGESIATTRIGITRATALARRWIIR